jgi:hypothetical protein
MDDAYPAFHPVIYLIRHAHHGIAGTVYHGIGAIKNKYHRNYPRQYHQSCGYGFVHK